MISTGYESLPHYAHNPKVRGSNPLPASRGLETGIELRRVPERCQPLGKWGLDLLPNLLPNFEKHGKHGIHGKVMVNERISLR